MIGTVIAGHRVVERFSWSAIGPRYRAIRLADGEDSVITLLDTRHLDDRTLVRRFERHVQSLHRITHPNIVPVVCEGEHGEQPFIISPRLDAKPLETILWSSAVGLDHAFALTAQIAAGLDAAHAGGLTHGGLCPAVVLVAGEIGAAHISVADFGFELVLEAMSRTTNAGISFDYMSPERIRGEDSGPATDVYALGCIFYALAAGMPPFADKTGLAVLWAHLQDQPPALSSLGDALPPALDEIAWRALAKEPEERFPSAGAFAAAIATALERL